MKFSKIILINLFLIVGIFIFAEIFANLYLFHAYSNFNINNMLFDYNVKIFNPYEPRNFLNRYRKPKIKNGSKRVLIMGCSYAYGYNLTENEHFSKFLADDTDFSVYNLSFCAAGPPLMLYQLTHSDLKKYIPDCDYIIYVYIPDHINRCLKCRSFPFNPFIFPSSYLDKDGRLHTFVLNRIIAASYIYRLVENAYPKLYGEEYEKKLFAKIVEEANVKSKELYPNSKFIIFNYSYSKVPYEDELKSQGIKIIGLNDISSEYFLSDEYQLSDGMHPNMKAWRTITPLFIEQAGLK